MFNKTPNDVRNLLSLCDGKNFNLEVFSDTGVFIIRDIFPESITKKWIADWNSFYSIHLANNRLVGHNKVEIQEHLPESLQDNFLTPQHLEIAKIIVGEDVGLYNHRFTVKDKFSRENVFLHQDSCYHIGFPNKFSFFTPFTKSSKENGGLGFYLGTHQYGSLGDAGEINPNYFDDWPVIHPTVNPGDLVVMNSCTWHFSSPCSSGEDRIIADTILQPASDPSTKKLICGSVKNVLFLDHKNSSQFFTRSRVSKIIELTNKINDLQD